MCPCQPPPPAAAGLSAWKPDLEDSRCVLIIDGALLLHGGAVGALAQGDYLQPKHRAVSPRTGPKQGHL